MIRTYYSKLIKLLILFLFAGISLTGYSQQQTDTLANNRSLMEKINDKMVWVVKWFPLPVVSYNTETNWLFGLTKFNSFKLGTQNQSDPDIPSSTLTGLAYYTLNKQYKFVVNSDLFFGKSGWRNYSQFIISSFPTFYYGVGNNTKLSDQCLVTFDYKLFTDALGYNFYNNLYGGIIYSFKNYTKIEYNASNDIVPCSTPDTALLADDGVQSGLGIMLYNEARDNTVNAHTGSYFLTNFVMYRPGFGSKFNYSYFLVDYRKYFPLSEKMTLATQFYSEINFGDVPVQSLALMGGAEKMRGVYLGRYRDKLMTIVQTEFRFPIYWILSAVAFGGLGEVAPAINGYTFGGIKWSAGAGLRLLVDPVHKANIRFDYGISSDQRFFFFGFGEAF